MKVAVMEGIGKMGYTKRPIPTPKSNEVLGKLEYVGICGSDMHYYETGAIGDYVVKPPFVLGHEPGGVVVEVGADGVINGKEQDAVQALLELTDGRGCDLAIETAGTEFTTRQCIQMTKKGATIVLVGYSKAGEITLPMSLALDKELTFKTVFRYRHIYPMAIDAVAAGKVNLKGIVTNIFDFDDIQNAMDQSVADKANIVKAVVRIGKEC